MSKDKPITVSDLVDDLETWLIFYDDADRPTEMFAGCGATEAALRQFDHSQTSWNCHLFRRVASNRDELKALRDSRTPPAACPSGCVQQIREALLIGREAAQEVAAVYRISMRGDQSDRDRLDGKIHKIDSALAMLAAVPLPQRPSDWVCVPREPTEAMLDATDDLDWSNLQEGPSCDPQSVYALMLSAAPPPPAAAEGKGECRPIEVPIMRNLLMKIRSSLMTEREEWAGTISLVDEALRLTLPPPERPE